MAPLDRRDLDSRDFTAQYSQAALKEPTTSPEPSASPRRRLPKDRLDDQVESTLLSTLEQSFTTDTAAKYSSQSPSRPVWPGRRRVMMSLCKHKWERLLEDDKKAERRKRDKMSNKLRHPPYRLSTTESMAADAEVTERLWDMLDAEQEDPYFVQREPLNDVQVTKVHGMINDLTDQLLQEAYMITQHEHPTTWYAPPSSLESPAQMIRLLRSEGYPAYDHPSLPGVNASESRRKLNEFFHKFVREWDPKNRQFTVAKICYNLLVCPVAPGIHNYNTLIAAFHQIGEYSLAGVVVDSFLQRSHLKPTQATFVCLVEHYRLRRDVVGFYNVIRRLMGHDTRGIGLGRRVFVDSDDIPYIQAWAGDAEVHLREGFANRRAHLSQELLMTILHGLIDLGRLTDAAKVMGVFMQEKQHPGVLALNKLIAAIVSTADSIAARTLVESLAAGVHWTTITILDGDYRKIARRRLLYLIYLAAVRQSSWPGSQPILKSDNIGRILQVLLVRDKLSVIGESLGRLKTALGRQDLAFSDLIHLANWEMRYATRRWKRRAVGLRDFCQLAVLVAIQDRGAELEQVTKALQLQFGYIRALAAIPEAEEEAIEYSVPATEHNLQQQLAQCHSLRDQVLVCAAASAHLTRVIKYTILGAIPAEYRLSPHLWEPDMTIDRFTLNDLILTLAESLVDDSDTAEEPALAELPSQNSRQVDSVVRTFSGLVASYTTSGMARVASWGQT